MADIEEATRDREEVSIDGQTRTIRYLNTYDKATLVREMRKGAKAALLESLTMAGLEPADKAQALADFDQDPPGNWVDYVGTHEGTLAALKISLEKTYPREGEAILRNSTLAEGEAFALMLRVCGLRVVDSAEAKTGADPEATYGDAWGENESDPSEPLTYGTPETTTPTTAAATN